MAPNQEQPHESHVVTPEERRDRNDGWEKGCYSPYPRNKERLILANVEKVSPAYVEGYWHGRWEGWAQDIASDCEWYPYTGEKPTNRFL